MTSHNHLLRSHAPIPVRAWQAIDAEAKERLTPLLAGRRLADFVGEGGWRHDAMSLGRTAGISGPPDEMAGEGVIARQRRVLPLVEFRVPFTVPRSEIGDIQRGGLDPELDDLARAARVAAELENRAILTGWPGAGIEGIASTSPYDVTELGDDCSQWPGKVAVAVDTLRQSGVDGPYALSIGPEHYTKIVQTTENGGYLLLDHLARILGGPSTKTIIRTPGVGGAVVLSQRGGDFLLDVGQDLSVGYTHHDGEVVHLYLEESFTFLCAEPDAAIVLS